MEPSADRLREFVTVVRTGSISRAARLLDVPRATLSRRINGLERELGVRLLQRRSRPMRLTQAGEALYGRAARIVRDTRTAWEAVRMQDGIPRGLLRVSLPPSTPVIHDYIVEFVTRYPEIELVVTVDPRHVDLQAEGIDVAVRVGPIRQPSAVARRIWSSAVWAFASPAYLQEHGEPKTVEDLAAHRCIATFDGEGVPRPRWPLRLTASASPEVNAASHAATIPITSRLVCGDIALLQRAIEAGRGIGMLPEDLAWQGMQTGVLVRVLPDALRGEVSASAVYLDREYVLPQMRVFIDGLVEHMRVQRASRAGPSFEG